MKHNTLRMGRLEHTQTSVVTLLWHVHITAGTNGSWSGWFHLSHICSIFQRRAARKDSVMGWKWAENSRLGTLGTALGEKIFSGRSVVPVIVVAEEIMCCSSFHEHDCVCSCTDGEWKKPTLFCLQIDGEEKDMLNMKRLEHYSCSIGFNVCL